MTNKNKYYEIIGTIEGTKEVLYGSFVRSECTYELKVERASWKDDGYKGIKIVSRETTDIPDPEVYEGEIITSKELFTQQAPSFNFELNEQQLVKEAIIRGYVTKIAGKEDQYLINSEY